MDWLFRTRGSTGSGAARSLIEDHLRCHARAGVDLDGALGQVDALVSSAGDATPGGPAERLLWGHLDWTALRPSLAVSRLDESAPRVLSEEGIEPDAAVHPRYQDLLRSVTEAPGRGVSLQVERESLQDKALDPALLAALDVDPVRDGMAGVPATLLAAAEAYPTASATQLAILAGARLADVIADGRTVDSAEDAADLFVEAHTAMGGGPQVLRSVDDRIEFVVDQCPFNEDPEGNERSLCRVCVAMLGRLAARVNGRATVVPEESTGLGDALCHLQVFLGEGHEGVDGQVFAWPGGAAAPATDDTPRMELSVALPRETASVPVVRRLAGQALRAFGVTDEHIDDVQLAITEACANVIEHAVDTDTYEVNIELAADRCAITVIDKGTGFDPADVPEDIPEDGETGRGLRLMRALVDTLAFDDEPQTGAVVHLVKELEYDSSHPLHARRLRR